jgi:hypothetical protein
MVKINIGWLFGMEHLGWDSLSGGFTQTPGVMPANGSAMTLTWKIIRYKNKIYFAGGIVWVNGKNQYWMAVWNGTSWDYPIVEPPNGPIRDFTIYNDTLYACGDFTKFGNTTCNYVAKFGGSYWQPVGDFTKFYKTFGPPAHVSAIEAYNGEIYIGGGFDDSTGTTRNIAKFNGTKWTNVGTGIQQGGINFVAELEVFHNRLYIGGLFGRTPQIPGGSLVMWDGNNYLNINSLDITNGSQVQYLKAHKDKLWALGNFNTYGASPIINMLYLDTNNVGCGLANMEWIPGDLNFYNIERVEFMGDSLIVGGLFKYLGGVEVNSIGAITNYTVNALCQSGVGINENTINENDIRVFPNPTNDKLFVEINWNQPTNLQLSDGLGRIIENQVTAKEAIFDLKILNAGIYFLRAKSSSNQKILKIIKN